jgi:hypothetical protein
VTDNSVATAHRLLVEEVDALSAAAQSGAATDAELFTRGAARTSRSAQRSRHDFG